MENSNLDALATRVIDGLGGERNIASVTHCATRLRFELTDPDAADKAVIESAPGVIAFVVAGGQHQVVVGNNVALAYAEVAGRLGQSTATDEDIQDSKKKGSLLNRAIELISALFLPITWPLAGTALLKAFVSLFAQLGWLDPESTTYVILAGTADALFFFLPVLLAVTAAKRFRTNQFTSITLAGILLYPAIAALAGREDVDFLSIPVTMMSYSGSVIPIIVGVFLQGHLERLLNRVLASWARNFMTPLLTLLILGPVLLLTVGPLTMTVANGLSAVVLWVFANVPWLGGALIGGLWQVFVLFGLHWGIIPLMINDIGTQGFTMLSAPTMPAVLAQAAAALAVLMRSRSARRRAVAGPAAVSGFLAGVSEPAIYGINLPLKRPFYFGIAAGAIGGIIVSLGGSAATSMIFPSIFALPAFLEVGNFVQLIVGTAVAIIIAFTLTFFFADREKPDTSAEGPSDAHADTPRAATGTPVGTGIVLAAPATGHVIALPAVPDKAFSSGSLGPGFGVRPVTGDIVAPIDGEIVVVMRTGHAFGIRDSLSGVDVLVHIGINTVSMKGDGFAPRVAVGNTVRRGDLLGTVDLAKVAAAGLDATTIVVATAGPADRTVDFTAVGDVRASEEVATLSYASALAEKGNAS
ncbi:MULTISPECIES: beta-glucoside-specific PTS transporter subunit IIABC [unclassified Arthrobacter]|uniref:beta-glucoside-specific PTS transporter subunit IIABC n=1 Tax=unclassified Arthrobacter TaxID=235627 RepID=UPI0015E2792E|nr:MULTISPECIES: beta-glucoside-specific PTS transporter subunit IIABC [unclassified Arthrobacter]